MTIPQILADMQKASQGFSAGAKRAKQAAESLRSLGRSAALAGLCVLPSLVRQYRKTLDEYEDKQAADRLEAHRRAAHNTGPNDGL